MPFFENANGTLYLAIMVLMYGLVGGTYLLYEWYKHGRNKRPLLYFSAALIGLYLFEIPTIIENSGVSIAFSRFNAFFALAFPLNFYARLLIGSAIFILANRAMYAKWRPYLFFWALIAAAFYAYIFWGAEPIAGRWPIVISISLFYLPIHALTLTLVGRWLSLNWRSMKSGSIAGAGIIFAGVALALVRCFLVIQALLSYPTYFWFLAYSSGPLFVTELAYTLCLLVGFFLLHIQYLHGPEDV